MTKFLLLTCLFLFHPSAARACSCVEEKLPEKAKIAKARAQAHLVFIGRVAAEALVERTDTAHLRTRAGQDTVVISRSGYRQYTFAVAQPLKGPPVGATAVVLTAGSGSSCGVSYRVGAELVVFAYIVDTVHDLRGVEKKIAPYYVTGLCTRTKELRHTKASELRQLRRAARRG